VAGGEPDRAPRLRVAPGPGRALHVSSEGRKGPDWLRRIQRPDGMVEAWADVDGRPVRSLSLGRPSELPEVVLLPGLGAPSELYPWLEQTATWTRGTVLDLPGWRGGRGRSPPSTVAGVGVAAAGWLETRARRDIVLVGHSSGAQSAIRTARLVPGRLVGLVLVGPPWTPGLGTRRTCWSVSSCT
jgi:pimeloyl-ACP methyl ester carboxylesterase